MSGRQRTILAALLLLGILAGIVLFAFAGMACPIETEAEPCPDAGRNLVVGIAIAALAVGLLVTPFAFIAEFVGRGRIVYRGAWGRAARRGVLAGLVVVALAGLRLGGALNVPTGLFVFILAGVIEWFFTRNDT